MALGWTVPELNERMSAYEAAQKEILEYIDPWGPKRGDYQAARIVWAVANVLGGKMSFKKVLEMFDFCEKYEQTDDEVDQIFGQIQSIGKQ